ncbi:MAG: NYN domain-containing protein [Candidatus Uhrbacteria bacterium]
MTQGEIAKFFKDYEPFRQRTIVIVDFGNVEKWKNSLNWKVGVPELARLVKNFSTGKVFLRRFYYGADFGKHESNQIMTRWSEEILNRAKINGFEVVAKRVKYICSKDSVFGFEKKCDLDVEMAIDLIQERDNYDTIVLFSGDGDLVRALEYLEKEYRKRSVVMSARGHIGREVIDAQKTGTISEILFADDFEYRLNMERFVRR